MRPSSRSALLGPRGPAEAVDHEARRRGDGLVPQAQDPRGQERGARTRVVPDALPLDADPVGGPRPAGGRGHGAPRGPALIDRHGVDDPGGVRPREHHERGRRRRGAGLHDRLRGGAPLPVPHPGDHVEPPGRLRRDRPRRGGGGGGRRRGGAGREGEDETDEDVRKAHWLPPLRDWDVPVPRRGESLSLFPGFWTRSWLSRHQDHAQNAERTNWAICTRFFVIRQSVKLAF